MAVPILPIAIGAGLFGAGAFLGGSQKAPRMAGQGPDAAGGLKPGTPFINEEGQMKIWGGPNYGAQSPESWAKLTGGQPNVNIEMGQARGSLPEPTKAPPLELPETPPIPGGGMDFPQESAEAQSTADPNLERILKILEGRTSTETINELEEARLERLIRAQQALAEQSYAKGQEISRRQAEIERLRQWGAVEQTRIAANVTGNALLAQGMYLSAIPNVSVMDAMTKGTQAALAPFQFKLGTRS